MRQVERKHKAPLAGEIQLFIRVVELGSLGLCHPLTNLYLPHCCSRAHPPSTRSPSFICISGLRKAAGELSHWWPANQSVTHNCQTACIWWAIGLNRYAGNQCWAEASTNAKAIRPCLHYYTIDPRLHWCFHCVSEMISVYISQPKTHVTWPFIQVQT